MSGKTQQIIRHFQINSGWTPDESQIQEIIKVYKDGPQGFEDKLRFPDGYTVKQAILAWRER